MLGVSLCNGSGVPVGLYPTTYEFRRRIRGLLGRQFRHHGADRFRVAEEVGGFLRLDVRLQALAVQDTPQLPDLER